jgi:hypothetical protein
MRDFFAKFEARIQPVPFSGCWIWMGAALPCARKLATVGYGCFRRNGRQTYAHRAAYEAAHGEGSAAGLIVRHTCDVPLCVNPDHLLLGTNTDNMQDMRERGRSNFGERNGQSRLSEADITEIIRLRTTTTLLQREIAERFGIDQSAVSLICSGRRWTKVQKSRAQSA